MTETFDVCVIGAGPAGLATAATLRQLGVGAVVLDERPTPGGNVYRGGVDGAFTHSTALGGDYKDGTARLRATLANGLDVRSASSVTRIDGDLVTFERNGHIQRLRARHLVLATGAIERPMPFPGWTLPGVMGVGAAQLLLKQSGLVPDGRYVLCGNGPLLLLLAKQLIDLGVPPAAILETGTGSPIRSGLTHLPALLGHAGPTAKGIGFLAAIRRAGVPVHRGVTAIVAEGDTQVRAVRFTAAGRTETLSVDLILCHEGVIPNVQISLALDCRHVWDEAQASFRPVGDAWGETSRKHTFVVGDCAGILGAAAAPLSARLAALRIAAGLGKLDDASLEAGAREALHRIVSERRFRRFLDATYRPVLSIEAPIADDVVVCRCERVAAADVRAAVRDGAQGPAQAKVFTRCGMGLCQGRICGAAVTRIIAEETGRTRDEVGSYHPRFPLKPVVLAELAEAPENEETMHADAA